MAATTAHSSQFPTKQSHPDLTSLFDYLSSEVKLPSNFAPDSWQVLALATLTAGAYPDTAAPQLYQYLATSIPASEDRQALVRHMREILFKSVIIIGCAKPIEAVLALDKVVAPEDRDMGQYYRDWTPSDTHERGEAMLKKVYSQNLEPIDESLQNHADFQWLTRDIIYGLFLSDLQRLSLVDTSLTVLSGLIIQNLPNESSWHMRGMRRLGVDRPGVEQVVRLVKGLAGWMGVPVDKVGEVGDIEHQLKDD